MLVDVVASCLLKAGLFCFCILAFSSSSSANVLTNPGFESGSQGWQKSTTGGRSIDTTKAHSGANSQRMNVSSLYGREVYQIVGVGATAGTIYDARGWVDTTGAGGGGARIEVQWFNQQVATDVPPTGALIRTDALGTVTGTQAWTQVAASLTAPANAVQARFRLLLSVDPDGAGSAWFDDTELLTAPDVTPPVISNVGASAITVTGATITWTTDEASDSLVEYGLSPAYGSSSLVNSAQVISHMVTLSGLSPSTTYHYRVRSQDGSGNAAFSGDFVFTTLADTTPPTVSITAPPSGATVVGTISVDASASDNLGVAGVQYKLDGTNLGAEDTAAPYSIPWNSTTVADGSHVLEAVARDGTGNTGVSAPVAVTVANTAPTANALVNPGFESGNQGWQKSTIGGRSIDTTKAHSGANSQRMNVSSLYSREVYQIVGATAGAIYDARGWVDTTGAGGGGARIEVQWFNQQVATDVPPTGALIRTDALGTVTGTQAWTQVAASLTAPANAVQARFRLLLSVDPDGAGSAWFDDTELLAPPDLTPPTVSITFPLSGTSVSNTMTAAATASDNRGVAGVKFQVDGNDVGAEDTAAPFSTAVDTTTLSLGPHTLTAVARDTAGNWTTSNPVTIDVVDGASRRNIIVIMMDDQRFDTMQHMSLTSALLASSSVQFDYAFTTTPDCCPSRSSTLTGSYSHNTGVLQDYNQFGGAPAFNPSSTFATWLMDTGYRTGIYGKYLNSYFSISPVVPPGWSEFHVFVKNTLTNNDGDFYYNYELNDNGVVTAYGNSTQDYSTDVLTAKATAFVISTPASQPLLLYFAPYGPHDPATPHPSDVGSYANIPNWRPPSFNEADVSDKPLWVRNLPAFTQTELNQIDTFRRNQLETLQSVDRAVANVISTLQQTGRWNNTAVILMSDNGLMWGEHRVVNSKFAAYEESVRVPFWVRVPGLGPRQDSHLVANIDVAPTIAEWAGMVPLSTVDGMSLESLLNDPNAPWRTELLLEYLGPTINSNKRFQAVRTSHYVYVEHFTGERELYDLTLDPYQLTNAVNDPTYASVVGTMQSLLNTLKNS